MRTDNRDACRTFQAPVKAETESAAQPEFGDFPTTRRVFSIPRSTAYELEKAGEITFVRLRKRGHARGKVLVSFDSVRRYLARCAESAHYTNVGREALERATAALRTVKAKKPGRRANGVEA